MEGREKEMEGTDDGSVESEDPHEWSSDKVATFVRSLGAAQCFQSAGDQVMQFGAEILVNLYNTNKLKDKKDIHDVVLLLSKDDRPLSETLVKTWVDNYKSSLNRKKQSEKDTDPKDKDQE